MNVVQFATSQVKKQYDVHIQYWSKRQNKTVISYVGSLFIGHCSADNLVQHFQEFMNVVLGLNPKYLLHVGMEGPNMNKSFQKKLLTDLQEKHDTTFLNIGSCSLHVAHNSFRKGLKKLSFDFEEFIHDLNFFLKHSSARREDYKSMEEITEVTTWFMLQYVNSRWLSLKPAILRILDQLPNIKEYFLRFLPNQKNFKREIQQTDRYKRIIAVLKDKMMPSYLSFAAFAAQDFESFISKLQKREPMIHVLYSCMDTLLVNLLQKFVSDKCIAKEKEGSTNLKPKPVQELSKLDVRDKNNRKRISSVEIGTRTQCFLVENRIPPQETLTFRHECMEFYATAVEYLRKNLPYDSKLLDDCQVIHPEKRHGTHTLNCISRLSLTIMEPLKAVLTTVFGVTNRTSEEEMCDLIRNEWKVYQTIDAPEFLVADENKEVSDSYWNRVHAEFGLEQQPAASQGRTKRIDSYWEEIACMKDELGNPLFPHLTTLVKCLLSLSHGNATPESGFSINKAILAAHGNAIGKDTLVSLMIVKDATALTPKIS